MLRQILNVFETSPGPMSLDVLALQLDLEPTVLEGMLAELVRMGNSIAPTIAPKAPALPAGSRAAAPMCFRTPACVIAWLPFPVAEATSPFQPSNSKYDL